jgi:general stress protein CsbA
LGLSLNSLPMVPIMLVILHGRFTKDNYVQGLPGD